MLRDKQPRSFYILKKEYSNDSAENFQATSVDADIQPEERPGLTSYSKFKNLVSSEGTDYSFVQPVKNSDFCTNPKGDSRNTGTMRIISAASDDRSSIINSAGTPMQLLP
jgi:hypothetical protein